MVKSGLVVAVGAIALMTAAPAVAGGPFDVTNTYVEFGGGFSTFSPSLTDLDTNNGGYTPSATLDAGRASHFNAVFGGDMMSGLRGEVGVSVMNGSASFSVQGEGSGTIGVNAMTFALMGNVWKDFELESNLSLHIGGGLGAGFVRTAIDSNSGPTTTNGVGIAYMAGIGGSYALGNGASINLDLRLNGMTGNAGRVEAETAWETISGTLNTGMSTSINIGIRIPTGG
jgi:hypothetical protein